MVSCRGKALLVFWLLAVSICLADEQQQKIRVGVSQFAPFVMGDQPDKLGGYSIELWRSIADHLDLDYEFVICDGVKGKLEAVEQQKVDVAIGGITITSAREERGRFYPFLLSNRPRYPDQSRWTGKFSQTTLSPFHQEQVIDCHQFPVIDRDLGPFDVDRGTGEGCLQRQLFPRCV